MKSQKIWCMLAEKSAKFFTQTSQTLDVFCLIYLQENMASMSKSEIGALHQRGMILIITDRAVEWLGLIKLRLSKIIKFQIC